LDFKPLTVNLQWVKLSRNFKFDLQIDLGKSHLMSEKSTLKGGVVRVQGRIFKFKTPYLNLERGEAKNFKFGTRIDLGKSHFMHDKIPPKGA